MHNDSVMDSYGKFLVGISIGFMVFTGALTAWNHHITQGVGSTFLIISVWEPGKDPKSAYRYYLVKE